MGNPMHVPAPLRVEFRSNDPAHPVFLIAHARVHGAVVSPGYVVTSVMPRHEQWARAFLQGVRMAPLLAGVR